MSMRAVQLDFLHSGRRRSGSAVVLLAAALVGAFVVVSMHTELTSEAAHFESQAAKLERRTRGLAPIAQPLDDSLKQEIRRVNEVIEQLALPWERLFSSVEGATTEAVVLLDIAPDAKSGMVQISAQAADAQSMFDYVKRLEQQGELSQVYLLQHQRERQNPERPIRFLVSASWMPR
jgi:hypothetical protein